MIRLLLLSCGTNACTHIAKILKQKFADSFFVVGCDINKKWLVPSCEYLDDFVQCPYSSEPNYYSFILKICEVKKINWILPSFDADQFLFGSDNHELNKLGVKSTGISQKLSFYKDKILTNEFLHSVGIPVPEIYSLNEIEDGNEYFIKPIHGVGSIGAKKLSGAEIKKLGDSSSFVIQEVCSEPEYTLECFNSNGKIYSVCRERIASKSGVCTKARVFQNEDLQKYAEKLAFSVNLPHIFNLQFMKNSYGEYVCTDLNLRTAGGMSLSYAAGWDEVSALANIILGKDESTIIQSINKKINEQYVCRRYEETVTKIVKKRIAFDFDGTLLDSRIRHEMVMSDVLKKHGIILDASDLVSFKAEGLNNIAWLLSKGIAKDVAKSINLEWVSLIENEDYLKSDILYPDTLELLDCLSKENGLYLVTARNNKEGALKQINELSIHQYFTKIVIVDSNSESSALKARNLSEIEADVFVGDTESDYEAALTAHCEFKALSGGFRSEAYWGKKGLQSVYKNAMECLQFLLEKKNCRPVL